MIWFASWLTSFGIWPIARPEHAVGDVWFPLDLTLHLVGLAYVIPYCRKQITP